MKNNKRNKIQELVVRHLKEQGTLDLVLPDGIVLEIGITQMDLKGNMVKTDDYCYVIAEREDRKTMLDSYNVGLTFADRKNNIVVEEPCLDEFGNFIKRIDVI